MKDHPSVGQNPRPEGNAAPQDRDGGTGTKPRHPLLVLTIVLLLLATAAAMLTSGPATDYGELRVGRPPLPAAW